MFRRTFGIFFLLISMLAFPAGLGAAPIPNISRNLGQGMEGDDVLGLQQFLNRDPRTRIAEIGIGAPGKETRYFGAKTKEAVRKFQELYASDVLYPAGLYAGTGFVGTGTRAKIQAISKLVIFGEENPAVPASLGEQPAAPSLGGAMLSSGGYEKGLATWKVPILIFPSKYVITPGEMLTISGGGYLKDNVVKFGEKYSLPGPSTNGVTIKVRIPDNAPLGKYKLSVKNDHGETEFDVPLVIKDASTPSPTITRITPSSGKYGTEIILEGTGFMPTGNDIRAAGWAILKDLPSPDGKTLRLTVLPFPDALGPDNHAPTTTVPFNWNMRFFVVNANGITETPGTFLFSR